MDGLILIGVGLILILLSKVLKEKDSNNADKIMEAYNRGFMDGCEKNKSEILEELYNE